LFKKLFLLFIAKRKLSLQYEVDICRIEQPFIIEVPTRRESTEMPLNEPTMPSISGVTPMEVDLAQSVEPVQMSSATASTSNSNVQPLKDIQCYPQRAALLKSMLNFLKKAIQDPAFADGIRHRMTRFY
jgi:hypothetical protein